MKTIRLPLNYTPLPPGVCFQTWTGFLASLASSSYVELSGDVAPLNYGSTQPAANLRDRPWMVLDSVSNAPVQGIGLANWSPVYGQWVVQHTAPASGAERRIYVGSLTDLETYDGGSSGTVSDTTGPFWQEDTAFQDKFPLGVGTTSPLVATNKDTFNNGTPGAPQSRSVFIVKRTSRIYRTYA